MMLDIIDWVMKGADFFRVEKKSDRDRKHDEELYGSLNEIVSSDEVSELCDALCDEAEYYDSQFQPLLNAVEFIENDDNEFINDKIENEAADFANEVSSLWDFIQGIVLPHHRQDDEDTRYTFNYKRWDRDVDDYESASEEFQDNMKQTIALCEDLKAAYKSLRDQVREDLAL